MYVVGRAGDERRQGHSARNNGQSLSAGGPSLHESAGASKDARPSAENIGYHRSLPVITHTYSLCRLSKRRPSSRPSGPQGCSICQKFSVRVNEGRKMEAELKGGKLKKNTSQCPSKLQQPKEGDRRKEVKCEFFIRSSTCDLLKKV